MRLAIVSSRFPAGSSEPYLGAELENLRAYVAEVIVVPARAALGSPRTLWLALATIRRAPRRCIAALGAIVASRCRLLVTVKNLAIFPRALALAETFRRDGIEHVHAYWLSAPATVALVIARVNGIPWSASAHRRDIFEENMIVEKVGSARFVRAISARGAAELRKRVPELAQKIVVVRLGTALRATAARATYPDEGQLRLLCAAAFIAAKGHRDLIDAFSMAYGQDDALRLVLCGLGPLEPEIRRLVAERALSSAVEFRGYVPRRLLLREMQQGRYDAAILASLDDGVREMEGIPSILIEAASLGIACIATRSGSVGELLDDRSAFLAPPRCPDLLARAILEARNPDERRHRAELAMQRARALHDPDRNASALSALIGVSA
jgi:colanic acid/amylovoran biosynthesis glycosyltransferase